jgi:hypothetical protein
LAFKIVKIYPHPVTFSLRFFKSDRLLASSHSGYDKIASDGNEGHFRYMP